jgi:hypothetical protein
MDKAMIRTISINHPNISSIRIVEPPYYENLANTNSDIWVELKNGQTYSFTVFTVRNIDKLMSQTSSLSFVSPGMLIVKTFSDEAIIEAVTQAEELNIERFGILAS